MALVPFDDRDGCIWWDGDFVPWRSAKLHVLSHGLHYASGVFEGERCYSGNIFKLRAHTDRLIGSARILGFDIPWTADEIDAACIETVRRNSLTDAYVRPIAWRGSEETRRRGAAYEGPPGDRRLGMGRLFRRRAAHEGRAPVHGALAPPAPRRPRPPPARPPASI